MSADSFAALFEAQSAEAQRGHREVHVGDILDAVVVQIDKETIFVELDAKRQGAIDIAEMRSPDGALEIKLGDTVRARVIAIDSEGVQLRRVVGATKPATNESAPEKVEAVLPIGSIVQGRVVRIESYGVFVQVAGTEGRDGRGLVPISELVAPRGADLRKLFPENTQLTAKVVENAPGRLKLSVKGALDEKERAEFEAHKEKAPAPATLGTLGDLLKTKKSR